MKEQAAHESRRIALKKENHPSSMKLSNLFLFLSISQIQLHHDAIKPKPTYVDLKS